MEHWFALLVVLSQVAVLQFYAVPCGARLMYRRRLGGDEHRHPDRFGVGVSKGVEHVRLSGCRRESIRDEGVRWYRGQDSNLHVLSDGGS
jgi:hypothetical protein